MAVLDETFVPSDKDIEKAKAYSRTLAREIAPESRVTLQREGDGEAIEIPDAVFNVLMKVLSVISEVSRTDRTLIRKNFEPLALE